MFSPKPSGKWRWRHLVREAFWKFKNHERFLLTTGTHFWILSRDTVPLKTTFSYSSACHLFYYDVPWVTKEKIMSRESEAQSMELLIEDQASLRRSYDLAPRSLLYREQVVSLSLSSSALPSVELSDDWRERGEEVGEEPTHKTGTGPL